MPKPRLTIFLFTFGLVLPLSYASAGTVVSPHKYAWSNNVGYINFENVTVSDSALGGNAWSANKGFIKFNPAQGGVLNDGTGNLSGSAWGEQLGWIDFNNVSIDGSGTFSGTATGTLVGAITFDCPNYCDVQTDWRPATSSVASSNGGGGGEEVLPNAVVTAVNPNANITLASPVAIQKTAVGNVLNIPTEQPALFDVTSESVQPKNQNSSLIPVVGVALIVGIALGILLLVIRRQLRKRRMLATALLLVLAMLVSTHASVFAQATNAQINTTSAGLVTKVAPGELLPVSVKLLNFGGGKKVDVIVTYEIFNAKEESIYQIKETVAVETTASFVKTLQIPFTALPGIYTAKTSIIYGGQLVPATTQFPFRVERKIFGLFQNDFFLYGGITAIVGVLMTLLGHTLIKRRRTERLVPFDYSNIPHGKRTFYEILSDTIMEMRERVGDDALDIAANIDGLKIDKATGRVLALTDHPSKIIATLVSEYEKLLGKKVSFSLRR